MDVVSAGAWFGRHVGDDAHGALWERDGDSLGVEGFLDPKPQVTLYLPLRQRIGLNHKPKGHGTLAQVLDALHDGIGNDGRCRARQRLLPHCLGYTVEHAHGPAHISFVGNVDVDNTIRPQL